MPTTLTLKNIPDEVYERLKLSAEVHRRSMNSEAIVCLETALLPSRLAPEKGVQEHGPCAQRCQPWPFDIVIRSGCPRESAAPAES
jgi:hypothetical protein